jgi:hypothetical protein
MNRNAYVLIFQVTPPVKVEAKGLFDDVAPVHVRVVPAPAHVMPAIEEFFVGDLFAEDGDVADDEAGDIWGLFGGDDEVRAAPPVADEIWVPPYADEIDDAPMGIGSLVEDDDDESMVIGSLFDDDEVPQIAPESKPAKSATDDTMPRVSIRRSHESFTSPSFATKAPSRKRHPSPIRFLYDNWRGLAVLAAAAVLNSASFTVV